SCMVSLFAQSAGKVDAYAPFLYLSPNAFSIIRASQRRPFLQDWLFLMVSSEAIDKFPDIFANISSTP
ncbi:MAG: hypothetical protein Q4G52_09325, partial [Clostridia bacterium]|nr:hypothetical protein [Clostridia bacterium]